MSEMAPEPIDSPRASDNAGKELQNAKLPCGDTPQGSDTQVAGTGVSRFLYLPPDTIMIAYLNSLAAECTKICQKEREDEEAGSSRHPLS